jgi:hypothetical protein
MKIRHEFRVAVFMIIITGFFAGCEKDTDYRDKYAGNWNYNVEVTKVNIDSIGHSETYNYNYAGEIELYQAGGLQFIYGQNDSVILSIDETGELSNFPTQYCSGKFTGSDSLYLFLRWGGLGGYVQNVIIGTKQD